MDRQTDDFTAFVADCEQQLRGTALLLTGDPAQVDDLVVAALARTHRRWRRLDSPAAALADTRATLVAAALGHSRLSGTGGSIGTMRGPGDDRPDGGHLDPGDRRMLDALAHLGPRTRAVVVLRLVDGADEESVAELLGRSPQAVADALATAVQTLGALLADEAGPGPQPVAPVPAPGRAAEPSAAGDAQAVFRRPGGVVPQPAPPERPAPAPVPQPAGPPPADDDPWAIYRRPT